MAGWLKLALSGSHQQAEETPYTISAISGVLEQQVSKTGV
jgi:hypothetical protein